MGEKREKFNTVSARLVFSGIIVVLLVALIVGLSIFINHGPIMPILGILGTTTIKPSITISAGCSPLSTTYKCLNPTFNASTGILSVCSVGILFFLCHSRRIEPVLTNSQPSSFAKFFARVLLPELISPEIAIFW